MCVKTFKCDSTDFLWRFMKHYSPLQPEIKTWVGTGESCQRNKELFYLQEKSCLHFFGIIVDCGFCAYRIAGNSQDHLLG